MAFSDMSAAYHYETRMPFLSARTAWDYYDILVEIDDGISGDITLENDPQQFKRLEFDFEPPPTIDYIMTVKNWGTSNMEVTFSGNGWVLRRPFSSMAYFTPSSPATIWKYFYYEIYNLDGYVGPINRLYRTPDISIPDRNTTEAHTTMWTDHRLLMTTTTGNILVGGAPPHWFGKFYNTDTSINLGTSVSGWDIFTDQSQSVNSRLAYTNTLLTYELYQNGGLVSSGELASNIPLPTAGAYTMTVPYPFYAIESEPGVARLTVGFDTTQADKNPPYLLSLNVIADNRMTDIVTTTDRAEVRFSIADDVELAQVSLAYQITDTWLSLPLNFSGNLYTATLPILPDNTFIALRLSAQDQLGNWLCYETTPAFWVNANWPPPYEGGFIERISVDSNHSQGNNSSNSPSISADGRFVVFTSNADNLVTGDTNNTSDVFVHDRGTGKTERVSVDSNGNQLPGGGGTPSISGDGRFVAFESGDNIYVHDRITGQTELISQSSEGIRGNAPSSHSSISNDGRFVAFESVATNLVENDTNGWRDVFVRDRLLGVTTRISVASDGTQGNADSYWAAISGDGNFVVFSSAANTFSPDDTNPYPDIFLHDRTLHQNILISKAPDGTPGNGFSWFPAISADGQTISFASFSTNIVNCQTANNPFHILVYDRPTGQIICVTIGENRWSMYSSLSADGRYVAFSSYSSNFVPEGSHGVSDVFVLDRETRRFLRVSVSADGQEGDYDSSADEVPVISADGRYIAFSSSADNLVANDTNLSPDIFTHDRLSRVGPTPTYRVYLPMVKSQEK